MTWELHTHWNHTSNVHIIDKNLLVQQFPASVLSSYQTDVGFRVSDSDLKQNETNDHNQLKKLPNNFTLYSKIITLFRDVQRLAFLPKHNINLGIKQKKTPNGLKV